MKVGTAVREQILLHVEDEDLMASLFETTLIGAYPQVRLCRVKDGAEAIAFLRQTGEYCDAPRPDLILLDLGLPRRNGFEVLAEMQGNQQLSSLPVVVLTSSSQPADRRKSLELGALEFITKQPSLLGMQQAIQQAFRHFPGG